MVSKVCKNILIDLMCMLENKRMGKGTGETYKDIIAEKFPLYEKKSIYR